MRVKKENYNSTKLTLKESFKSFLSIFADSNAETEELEDFLYSNDKETSDIARTLLENSRKIELGNFDEPVVEKKRTRGRPPKASKIVIEPIKEINNNKTISIINNQKELDR